jgi:hypothetical protein
MPGKGSCTICRHTQEIAISDALAGGVPVRSLARRFGVSRQSLQRHAANHLPKRKPAAAELPATTAGDQGKVQLASTLQELERLQKLAERRGNLSAAAQFSAQRIRVLELTRAFATAMPTDMEVQVRFGPHGAETKLVPVGSVADVEQPAEQRSAREEDEAPAAAQETSAEDEAVSTPKPSHRRRVLPPRPPAPPIASVTTTPPHRCGPRCNTFTCSKKNEEADDPDPNDPRAWKVF